VHLDIHFEVPIYHIHGAIFGEKQHIVISQSDYSNFREQRRMLFELLKKDLATSTFLYIGTAIATPTGSSIERNYRGVSPSNFHVPTSSAEYRPG